MSDIFSIDHDDAFDLGFNSLLTIGKYKGCTVREVLEDFNDPGILDYYRSNGILSFTADVNREIDDELSVIQSRRKFYDTGVYDQDYGGIF
jgi:hypothetical protein